MADETQKESPEASQSQTQERTTVPKTEGNKSPSSDLVERAREEREGLVRENERLEKNLKELRELEASRLLGSTAGNHIDSMRTPEQVAQQKAQAMADEITHAFK